MTRIRGPSLVIDQPVVADDGVAESPQQFVLLVHLPLTPASSRFSGMMRQLWGALVEA